MSVRIDFRTLKTLPKDVFNVEVGDRWFNKEFQAYTDSLDTLFFTEQGMHLRALYQNGRYESARINTASKLTFLYGTLSITAKLPKGRGAWPAIWLLSDTQPFGGWPKSGEIDIVEYRGHYPDHVLFSLHTATYNHRLDGHYHFSAPFTPTGFHTYTLDWEENALRLSIDGTVVHTFEKGEHGRNTDDAGWPFHHPFHLLLNIAVGGMLGGEIVDADFPQEMIIQSIVYEEA